MSDEKCNHCGNDMSVFEEDPDDFMACGYWGCEYCNPARKREAERDREEQRRKEQDNG